jgi:hypothetical protein
VLELHLVDISDQIYDIQLYPIGLQITRFAADD